MKKILSVLVIMVLSFTMLMAANSLKAYTTLEEPLAKALFEQFEKETSIHVEWVRLTTGEAVARLEAERDKPQASIWVGGVGTGHIDAKNKGLTTTFNSYVAQTVPDKYKDPEKYWIGLYIGPIAFATNINRAKELGITPPKSWADLLKPEYKGRIRVANPATSGTAYNMVTNIIRINGDDEAKAFDYLKKLNVNIDQYTKSGSAPGKSCAIGEIPVAIGYAHDLIKLKVEGAPIEITFPSEGSGFETASMSLIKNGPDAVNAKKLYNWILGSKSMEIIASWYVIPVSSNAPKDKLHFDINSITTVNQNDKWDAENKERLIDLWNKEIGTK